MHRGLTRADVLVLIILFILSGILVLPAIAEMREKSKREQCASNLRTIMEACVTYASQNSENFPYIRGESASTYDVTLKPELCLDTPEATIKTIYREKLLPNNPFAPLWLLCLQNDKITPRLFICPEDRFAGAPAEVTGKEKRCYINFQSPQNISYSIAYMWKIVQAFDIPADAPPKAQKAIGEIRCADFWRNTNNASLPLMADMAPYLGKKARDGEIATEDGKMTAHVAGVRSSNHGFAGQNIVYADVHVDWMSRPDVGQANDNIWTQKVDGEEQYPDAGAIPAQQGSMQEPYDIVMIPTRSANGDLK